MSPHGRILIAAVTAGAVIVCCARLAEGRIGRLAEVLNPFGQESGIPPNHRTENLTQSALAASESDVRATPVTWEAGCPMHTGGVTMNTTHL